MAPSGRLERPHTAPEDFRGYRVTPGQPHRPMCCMGLPPNPLPEMTVTSRPLADVAVYGLQRRKGDRIGRPWVVRWHVDGRQRSRSFRVWVEAERYRTGLLVAQQAGEAFDPATGEPETWAPQPADTPLHEWARTWLAEQWDEWAPRTRVSQVEALVRFVPLAVRAGSPAPPDGLRAHLKAWLPPSGVVVDAASVEWLDIYVLPLGQLTRPVLGQVDQGLGRRDDGGPLAPATAGRLRKIARGCTRRAVELEILPVDPWPPPPRGRAHRKSARTSRAVAIRRLPDPETMVRIIEAVPNRQPASLTYRAMTAVAYYAGLRPSEVVALRVSSLDLPSAGWGRIDVTEAEVAAEEPGEPKIGAREVPIPPQLVAILREGWASGAWPATTSSSAPARATRPRPPTGGERSVERPTRPAPHPCASTTAATRPPRRG